MVCLDAETAEEVLDYVCDRESIEMDFFNYNKDENLDTGVIFWAVESLKERMRIYRNVYQALCDFENELYSLAEGSPTSGQKHQFLMAYDFICDFHSLIEDDSYILDSLQCQMLWR